MQTGYHINYLRHNEIEKNKWDTCIDVSPNGLIYGYSFYLDNMAANWDALVLNDYEAVMPLTWNKKYGVYYLYQPFLTAQLGVFGKNTSQEIVDAFLKNIPSKFKLWEISLNHANDVKEFISYSHRRMNYVLNLNESYDTIYKNYRENIKRNIKKALKLNCKISTDINISDIIKLTKLQMKDWSESNFKNFEHLHHFLKSKGQAKSYGVLSSKNELLASCIFLFSNKRAYYILVGNHPNGRTLGASHALIDAFIKDHSEQDLLLDFEGSDIRNLAFFYSSFGAREEKYTAIKYNHLPVWMKWLKK